MSDWLPLFPLPNVVLFPNVFLPLHVFEPRYREMVTDALASDRLIGMVLLRPGWEREYEGRPAVFPVGCSGVITHVERLPDGRYNIVLRGVERFTLLGEDHDRSYRRGIVEPLVEARPTAEDRAAVRALRTRLEALLTPALRQAQGETPSRCEDLKAASAMGDDDLVNALSQYLELEPIEKQALLELGSIRARAASLVELLEMKMMMARTPGVSHVAH
jgi:Lon protease-like protein